MKTEIIIARYNEDLSWLKKIPKTIKITIYNKGLDDIKIAGVKYDIIKLPNIGRESHTYLYHIINNYDNLAHKTIFCQGDSIFHSPGFLDLLKNVILFEPVQPLSAFYWPEGEPPHYFYNPPKPLLDETKYLWIKKNPIHVEYMDNNFVTKYPYFYYEQYYIKLVEFVKETYNVDNIFKFFVERFRLKNVDINDLFPVCYAGLFCVNKEVILENSIDFYNNILSMLLYDYRKGFVLNNMNMKFIDWGLFLEKLWLVIFNYKKHNKNYIKLKIKDYPIYNYNLTNTESFCSFKLFNIISRLYMNITIDNKKYTIIIMKHVIYLKYFGKIIHKNSVFFYKKFQDIFKHMNYITVNIKLYNNTLNISINDLTVINYTFKYIVNKINNVKLLSIMPNNKVIDLLNPHLNIESKYTKGEYSNIVDVFQ